MSFVFGALREQLDAVYDVTIAYAPLQEATMWDFVRGRLGGVRVRGRRVEAPAQEEVKEWIERLWREKDALLDRLL